MNKEEELAGSKAEMTFGVVQSATTSSCLLRHELTRRKAVNCGDDYWRRADCLRVVGQGPAGLAQQQPMSLV
jgi:hypothetical protein